MNPTDASNYSDTGAHKMTAEERAEGIEGVAPIRMSLPHELTTNSNNQRYNAKA